MDPKPIRFEATMGRRPVVGVDERTAFAEEGRQVREADERDGTNAFLEALFDETLAEEPDHK